MPWTTGWWIVAGVLGLWLFWPRKGEGSTATAAPSTRVRAEPEEPEDPDVRRARGATEEAEQKARDALEEHRRNQEGARATIARARKYVMDAGLDKALPELWETVRYWGSWVNLGDDRWQAPEGISAIEGSTCGPSRWTAWSWGGRAYKMMFEEKRNYVPDDPDTHGILTLEVDGEAVLTINCAQGCEAYDNWRYTGVEALKTGPWMPEVIRLASELKLARDRSTWETFAEIDRERAGRMRFDE